MSRQIRKGILVSVLAVAALALLAPAASAQTATADATATDSTTTTTTTTKSGPATLDTTAVTAVGVGSGVTSLAGDSNGNVYASLQYENKVVKLNGGGTEIARFAVGRNPTGLLVDNAGGLLYVLNNADDTVTKLRLDGTFVATYKAGGEGPVHAALYGGTLYIACERSNTLVRMSAADGTVLGSTPVGARPVWVALAVTTTKYYTTTSSDPSLTADPTATSDPTVSDTGTTSSSTTTTDSTMAPSSSTTTTSTTTSSTTTTSSSSKTTTTVTAYVSCNKADQVWKISSAGSVLARYSTGRGPYGLAVNGSGQVFVACFWDAVVLRLDGSNGTVLSKTTVGDGAAGMIPYGNTVAVVENGNNGITRMSLADGTVISRDKVDRAPLVGASNGSYLWVSCTGSGTIARRAL